MSMDLELGRKIVENLKEKFDEVAVSIITRDNVMVKLWNTEPSVVQSWKITDVTLRLAKDRRLFLLEYSTRDPEALLKDVEELPRMAKKIEEAEIYAPLPEPGAVKPVEGGVDHNALSARDELGKLVYKMLDAALKHNVDRVAGTLTVAYETRTVLNSKGFEASESKTAVEAYLRAFKGEFSGHWAYGGTRIDESKLIETGDRAGYLATISSNKVDLTPGKYTVILSPLVVGNLINYLTFMASAMAVIMGYSMFMKYKPGDKVAAETLTLLDKPRDPTLPGFASFDDEGVETFDKPIIENGRLASLMHNNSTASKMGAKSTGNAGWLFPHPWNLELSPGELSEKDLFKDVEKGVFFSNNWYTRYQNYAEGVFSTVSRDATLYVENGEVIGQVGRVRLSTSFPTLLANTVGCTRERYDVMWWEVRTPSRIPFLVAKDIMVTRPEI
ncbi:metallopeptidase TldD-related protein [Thermosphaera sp.]